MWNKDKSEVNNNYELHFTKPIEMGYVCSEQVKKTIYNRIDKVHITVYIHRKLPGDAHNSHKMMPLRSNKHIDSLVGLHDTDWGTVAE